jgi:alginate O-acetyltransferase complex protein AlgI
VCGGWWFALTIASFSFLAFALAVILAYNARPSVQWRKWVLLAANLAFLLTFSQSVWAFLPFAAFVGFGYMSVRAMQRSHPKAAYLCIVSGTLLAFFWLKKYTFIPDVSFLRFAYTTLGLSYIFFRVMHLIIDAHQGNLEEKVGLLSYLNFTLNFTTLVSGPIQRYPEFVEQHLAPQRPPLTLIDMGNGLERIAVGFFKVNALSLLLSMAQSHALNALSPNQPFGVRAFTGAIIAASYPIYLYFNFSGYTDIVIGVARFLRIKLPENFNRPFSTDNVLDFWNHWHITLSTWLKTYVYTPVLLSLMRRFPSPKAETFLGVGVFFVTFFLIGLWHGRTSEFLFYGFLLGAGLSANKLFQIQMAKILGKKQYKALSRNWAYQSVCRGLNFTFFSFSLLWFWSSWKDLGKMSRALELPAQLTAWCMIFAVSTIVLTSWETMRSAVLNVKWGGNPLLLSRYIRTAWDTGLVFVTVALMELMSTPAPDIVYKTF